MFYTLYAPSQMPSPARGGIEIPRLSGVVRVVAAVLLMSFLGAAAIAITLLATDAGTTVETAALLGP